MRTSVVVAGSLLSGLLLVAVPLQAQRVSADVVVRSGPVAGHVTVGDGYSTYRRRSVVYHRVAPRVVVIERVHRHHHRAGWWRKHGFRPVTVYYVNGRYYDRWDRPRYAREVMVYERDGRYYEICDRDHRHDRDRYHDRDD
jgi:hypothetical protein